MSFEAGEFVTLLGAPDAGVGVVCFTMSCTNCGVPAVYVGRVIGFHTWDTPWQRWHANDAAPQALLDHPEPSALINGADEVLNEKTSMRELWSLLQANSEDELIKSFVVAEIEELLNTLESDPKPRHLKSVR